MDKIRSLPTMRNSSTKNNIATTCVQVMNSQCQPEQPPPPTGRTAQCVTVHATHLSKSCHDPPDHSGCGGAADVMPRGDGGPFLDRVRCLAAAAAALLFLRGARRLTAGADKKASASCRLEQHKTEATRTDSARADIVKGIGFLCLAWTCSCVRVAEKAVVSMGGLVCWLLHSLEFVPRWLKLANQNIRLNICSRTTN